MYFMFKFVSCFVWSVTSVIVIYSKTALVDFQVLQFFFYVSVNINALSVHVARLTCLQSLFIDPSGFSVIASTRK